MSHTTANVIVDIDTLLDTRQGVLSKILTQEALLKLVTSDAYMHREYDEFPNVDMDMYKRIYAARDKVIISSSIVSFMFKIVRSKVVAILQKSSFNDDIREVNLLVNFYPYVLTTNETDAVVDVIFRKMELKTFIKPIFKSPEDFTPSYLNNANIEELFMYDTNRWINAQAAAIATTPIVKRCVHLPSILTNKVTEAEKQQFDKTGFLDMHAYLEHCMAPMVSLDYLPILFYGNIITASAEMEKLRAKALI